MPGVKSLDDALPDRRAKRGRGEDGKQGGRPAKRQTPDRRTEAPRAPKVEGKRSEGKKAGEARKRVTDDPTEKAKAEARAKRFASAA